MQTNRFQDSTVKAPSPLGRRQSTTFTQNTDHLDHILHSVRQQIERWGTNAKWKIDLVLTEPGQPQQPQQPQQQQQQQQQQPPSKPTAYSLPVSATTQYPWDYVPPYHDKWNSEYTEDQEQQLREALERNQYLEGIVRSQADQLRQSPVLPPDLNNVVETMKQVYLMSENEQRLRYQTETRLLHKDIQTLTKRLQRMAQILHSVEDLELPEKDAQLEKDDLLTDRKRLLQKVHLVQLRLKARDAELEFLQLKQNQHKDEITPATTSPALNQSSPRFDARNNRPYLFQQQYSPKLRSDIRPSTISGLDSLGILADQMLSDPDFESQHATYSSSNTPTYYNHEKRSKRSIDSANTLLSMFPSRSPQYSDRGQPISKPKNKMAYVRWTPNEDQLLRQSVEQNGTGNWDKVASMVPDRSGQQCRQRWSKYLDQRHGQSSSTKESTPTTDARHSPSIASLLNSTTSLENDGQNIKSSTSHSVSPPSHYSHTAATDASSSSSLPQFPYGYHPPSPVSTPKNQRRFVDSLDRNG
ncbi:uncharacterized protein BX664DRAFT_253500 [Halteromyces radiatus]|uniref:uncharacterized protein n=1 Tax=Halteromyces radiatus TaxID=101107 RepID=UPI00222003DB|nr:uncharacterized protein BX664DRAFT_253500 [Halteromyces radiatus]KAI8099934.1 hypothetical protein BX664DRAFT_253500 [Halteromyces radiatus]